MVVIMWMGQRNSINHQVGMVETLQNGIKPLINWCRILQPSTVCCPSSCWISVSMLISISIDLSISLWVHTYMYRKNISIYIRVYTHNILICIHNINILLRSTNTKHLDSRPNHWVTYSNRWQPTQRDPLMLLGGPRAFDETCLAFAMPTCFAWWWGERSLMCMDITWARSPKMTLQRWSSWHLENYRLGSLRRMKSYAGPKKGWYQETSWGWLQKEHDLSSTLLHLHPPPDS